jgi:hypothetical protein
MQVSFPGKLHITDKTACFKASEEDVSFTVPLKDIAKASKSSIRTPGSKPGKILLHPLPVQSSAAYNLILVTVTGTLSLLFPPVEQATSSRASTGVHIPY